MQPRGAAMGAVVQRLYVTTLVGLGMNDKSRAGRKQDFLDPDLSGSPLTFPDRDPSITVAGS
jgi:hypothetical protein